MFIRKKPTQKALKPKQTLPMQADKGKRELKDLPGSLGDHEGQPQGDLHELN